MRKASLWLLVVVVLLGGCASQANLERYQATANAYGRLMRWSDFGGAFALAQQKDAPLPDTKYLENIRVLSYDKVGEPRGNNDMTEMQQVVEIRYTHINKMNERTFMDQQRWIYSATDSRWKLASPFPTFR